MHTSKGARVGDIWFEQDLEGQGITSIGREEKEGRSRQREQKAIKA